MTEHGSKFNPSDQPEYHSENLYGDNVQFVSDSLKGSESNSPVGESDDRPDSAEKHVVGLFRSPRAIIPPRPIFHNCQLSGFCSGAVPGLAYRGLLCQG